LAFKPKGFRPANLSSVNTAASPEAEKKSLKPEVAAPASAPAPATFPTAVSEPVSAQFFEEKQPLAVIKHGQIATNSIANSTPVVAAPVAAPAPNVSPPAVPMPAALMAVPIREQGAGSARLDSRIAAVEPDAHHEDWVALVQQLLDAQALQGMVQQLAVQSQCVEKGGSHLTLRVSQPSLKSDTSRDELQSALQAIGRSEALVLEVGPVQDSWAKRNTAKLEAKQKAAEQLITQDPWVQELIAQWGAKIVPGSIKAV
jgi:DNA polymerase-3 subunit gamma/tau